MPLTDGVLIGDTETTIFTAENESTITSAYFCNNHDSDTITIDIYLVKNGSSPSTSNKIYSQIPIVAGDTFETTFERPNLGPGDSIVAVASTADYVSAVVSYVEKPS